MIINPLEYYRYKKYYNLIKKSTLFDAKYYLFTYKDVRVRDMDPIKHYILFGAKELRNPSPTFNTEYYLQKYNEVKEDGMNPLAHYIQYGLKEGKVCNEQQQNSTLSPQTVSNDTKRPISLSSLQRFEYGDNEYGPITKILNYNTFEEKEDTCSLRTCVHLHIYYLEQLPEFIYYLNNISFKYDLFISLKDSTKLHYCKQELAEKLLMCEQIKIKPITQNRGRDVSSWLVLWANEIQKYDLFFHAHTKKSTYSSKYRNWRRFLLHNMLGSHNITSSIYREFCDNAKLDLFYPAYFNELKDQPQYGANKAIMQKIIDKLSLNIKLSAFCKDYPAGSFFWCRTSMLQPLFDLQLTYEDFDKEDGSLDGTLAHGIERLLGYLPEAHHQTSICSTVDIAYNLINYYNKRRTVPLITHNKKYTVMTKPSHNSLKNKKIAVYTAVTGSFENFVAHPVIDEDIDYYCISDCEMLLPQPYQLIHSKYIDNNPRKTARHAKLHPHFYFSDYDYVIWVDANIIALHGFQDVLINHIKSNKPLSLIQHPVRESPFKEAEECINIKADDPAILKEQISYYKEQKLENKGLIETNIIIASLQEKKTLDFYTHWWSQIEQYSIRDQVSVNFALNTSGATYHPLFSIGKSARDDYNFMLFSHDFNEREQAITLKLEEEIS